MPPRIREVPQKVSPRDPHQQRRTSSESDHIHHRTITDRSPRLFIDRRSPRGSQSEPLNQKKIGTRVSDLETQLVQAQGELKNLKQQLASAEAAKKEAQDELHKKTKNNTSTAKQVERQGKRTPTRGRIQRSSDTTIKQFPKEEVPKETHKETDVFEVPMEKVSVDPIPELEGGCYDDENGRTKPEELSSKVPSVGELEKPSLDQPDVKNSEIMQLKAKLEAREKETEAACQENETLKKQLHELTSEITSTRSKEEEMAVKHTQFVKDLEASNATKIELSKKLEVVESAKEELETEMKKLRIQTDQWRKAADAAAAVLAGGVEVGGGRISERCGSMDKHFNSVFEPPQIGGYPGYLGSPDDDMDNGFGSGKRKGSGIRMFGELWKKKGQK